MTSENIAYVSNDINRRTIYAVIAAGAFVWSIFMFVLTSSFGAEPWEIAIFSIMPFLLIFAVFIGDMNSPVEIGVGLDGIQLVLKRGTRIDVAWKDFVSLQPYRAPDFYHLKYLGKYGRMGMCTLSREPANKVRRMWSSITGYDMAW